MIIRKILSIVFDGIGRFRSFLYLNNYLKKIYTDKKIISVGNLSMGGTGKTPMALMLARFTVNQGYNTALIEKGYKSKLRSDEIILVEKGLDKISSILIGDEASLVWEHLPNSAKLAVGKNKTHSVINVLDKWPNTEYVIVDDGFQHLKLHRSVDVVLIDANIAFDDNLFPLGRLREAYSSLKRANVLVFTKADNIDEAARKNLKAQALSLNPFLNVFFATMEFKSTENVKSKFILPVSAICNNKSYLDLLKKAGAIFDNHLSYPDHYEYRLSDIQDIREYKKSINAEYIVVTEKDWIKLKNLVDPLNDSIIVTWYEHKIDSLKEFLHCCLN